MRLRVVVSALLAVAIGTTGSGEDFETALARARESSQRHRYDDTIDILLPYAAADDPEVRYVTAAEIGRAYFHLGRYVPANRAFREAVAIHPDRPETAIYLEATSYLTGDTDQAFMIFEELLKSGARDLYLAVTLPGKRRFLAEPEVQALLTSHAIPLEVDVRQPGVMGVVLGESRDSVVRRLGAISADPSAGSLTAQAGAALIWAFSFDDQQRLAEIVLYGSNLIEYTPYRIRFASGIDWTATPAAAIAAWGLPSSLHSSSENSLIAKWDFGDHLLTVSFGDPGAIRPPDLPEGAVMIRSLRLATEAIPP